MVEDAKVGNKMSSITKLAKNLSASVNMAENAEVNKSDCSDDKTVERSPSKNSSRSMGYFISLYSNADSTSFKKRWANLIILNIVEALN